jgi:hypothetical protein
MNSVLQLSSAQPRPGSRVQLVGLALELPRTEGSWTGELVCARAPYMVARRRRCGPDFLVATVATTTPAIPVIRTVTVTAGDLAVERSVQPAETKNCPSEAK